VTYAQFLTMSRSKTNAVTTMARGIER